MAVSLKKGEKVNLQKEKPGLNKVMIGLGWNPVKKSGLFSFMAPDIDCDATAMLLDSNNKMVDVVYYGNQSSADGSINHGGDNRTGEGDGDDEVINVELSKVSKNVDRIIFIVTIYEAVKRNQDFSKIGSAYVRIIDQSNNGEIAKYDLSQGYAGSRVVIFGDLTRGNEGWNFGAVGDASKFDSLQDIVNSYRG